jgi:hypothetical protein
MAIAQLIGNNPLQLDLVGLQHCPGQSFDGRMNCSLVT